MERDENKDRAAGVLIPRVWTLLSGLWSFKQTFPTVLPPTPPASLAARSACRSGKGRTRIGIPRA